ncbi:Zn-dependent exopeptidase [Pseudovirgaria hyperparasitica]|uniref:Zn-dependent exopeptidase n=1 Tax=Pseudovirgaria hyperparasitica TaxID=470096 RepID=A0A6A6WBM9_9PEZI|nr:Zn-dependent exopeptidase [Pseudovirgaria hyperparasitica]KAF2759370.1 Zn-dependent exopeptidase [Pseudovirgaria hyperparasitica]
MKGTWLLSSLVGISPVLGRLSSLDEHQLLPYHEVSHEAQAAQVPVNELHKSNAHIPLLDTAFREKLLDLHKHLVEIESVSGNELMVGKWLWRYLINNGFSVERQEVEKDRYNIYAWGGNEDEKDDVEVILTSHIDTVPPFIPYSIIDNGTSIAGRGSVDAKGSVATQITAVLSLLAEDSIPRSKIGLLYVVGEEVNAAGMRFFSSSPLNKKNYTAVIFGEPTEEKLCSGHKGNFRLVIDVQGRAAHSGYPWLGLSANDVLVEALSIIKGLESGQGDGLPWDEDMGNTTVNIGKVEGGVAANVVAEHATAELLFRVAASTPEKIAASVEHALKDVIKYTRSNGGNFTLDTSGKGSIPVHLDCDIDGFECFGVNYGTDIPHMELSQQTKRYLYGPGSIFVAHAANEAVKIKDLEQAVLDYKQILYGIFDKEQMKGRLEL